MAVGVWRWTGVVDGDVSDFNNWDDGNGSAVATIPGDGADVQFTYGAVNADMNLATFATVEFNSLLISDEYTGSIGIGGPVYFQCQALNVYIAGGVQTVHLIDCDIAGDGALEVFDVGANLYIKGSIIRARFYAGSSELKNATILEELHIGQTGVLDIDNTCTISAASIAQLGGSVESDVAHGSLAIRSGKWTQTDGEGGNLILHGGVYKFNAIQHTLADAVIYEGLLDCSEDPHPKTINKVTLWERGRVNLNNGAGNIVVRDGIHYRGGTMEFTEGSIVRVSPVVLP